MQAALGMLFEVGNGIYHVLAGQFLFQGQCHVFKVRVVAPTDYRLAATQRNPGLSAEEALRFIAEADARRPKWGRQMFDADLNDPELYDLVVDLEHMSAESAADMITGIIRRKEFPPDCDRQFRNFALERRVQAALFFNSPFSTDIVAVTAEDGVIRLTGGRAFEAAPEEIVDFVSRVRGVTKVITDLGEVESVDATLDLDVGISTRDTTARDVMLAPDFYPHCTVGCTIREAIVAVSASAVKLEDGHIMVPRYVLVLDDEDQLVGIVSRRELLRGLVPQLRHQLESEQHIRELVPFGGHTPSEISIKWTSLFTRSALEAAAAPVRSSMVGIKGTVQVSDSLSTVISSMLHHGVDLIPVLDGRKLAGVVLMTNIFDIVAQFVMEHGGRDPGSRR